MAPTMIGSDFGVNFLSKSMRQKFQMLWSFPISQGTGWTQNTNMFWHYRVPCLHTGPSLQNKLWSILVRGRFHPVAITGDLQKAFLQVRIREEDDRDALRFYWRPPEQAELQTLRFTRALFRLAPSPFLLGGVIEHRLESWESRKPEVVPEIWRSLYVDDLISGSTTVAQAKELRDGATEVCDIQAP